MAQITEGGTPAKSWPVDGRQTGFAHPKCYAQALKDCSPTISAEHVLSRNILEVIDNLTVSGMSWQKPGESKRLTPSTMVAKVLCERHNNCLSDLDQRMGELFRLVRRIDEALKGGVDELKSLQISKAFWGVDLERWLLKVLLGQMASGNAGYNGQYEPRGRLLPEAHVRALFTPDPWPEGWGLYFPPVVGMVFRRFDGVSARPLWRPGGEQAIGITVEFMGVPWFLALEPPPPDKADQAMYRLKELAFEKGGVKRGIRLVWP